MMRLFAILVPPIVPLIYGQFGQFLINVLLTCLFWIPGIIHAWILVSDTKYEKGQQRENNTMTEHLYKASPSIWRTSPIYFLICVCLIPVVLGVYLLIIEYVQSIYTKFTITKESVTLEKGIFSKYYNEIRMKDIRQVQLSQSLWQRMFGAGELYISSSLPGMEIVISGLPNPKKIRALINQHRN